MALKKPAMKPSVQDVLSGLQPVPAPAPVRDAPTPVAPRPSIDTPADAPEAGTPARAPEPAPARVAEPVTPAATALRPTPAAKAAGESTYGRNRTLSLSMPVSLRTAVRALVKSNEDLTYDTVVFDAIEANIDRLPELVARIKRTPTKPGLFARKPEPPKVDRGPMSLFTLESNVQTLMQLAERNGADNMSQLVEAALTEYMNDR